MPRVNGICSRIREEGRRLTPQRQAIVCALLENGTHPTADQVIQRVRRSMPDISPATVYNTLHELEELGLIQEVTVGVGERRYDANTEDHDHIVCLGCGRIVDAVYDGERPMLTPGDDAGFTIVGHRVVFAGYCPACSETESR
ncbi:MAG: transcriptional repressor [Chloroflexi bacterium]|nr:transcriptional repressor [Chloroflexota bacterium]